MHDSPNQIQCGDRFSTSLPTHLSSPAVDEDACVDSDERYNRIACDPHHRHFVRIPERIIQCLDYFAIDGNRPVVRKLLEVYYLFIGVVDNAIDSGEPEVGQLVLHHFEIRTSAFAVSDVSDVALMTEALKRCISDEAHSLILSKLRELYHAVVSERAASSMGSYIERRQAVGRLTAELSYLLIRPALQSEEKHLCEFMQQVGTVGCLVDSIIDLRRDSHLGLVAFPPTIRGYVTLIIRASALGLRIALKTPRLSGLFLQAIADNVRDRLGRKQRHEFARVPANRKDEAPSVA